MQYACLGNTYKIVAGGCVESYVGNMHWLGVQLGVIEVLGLLQIRPYLEMNFKCRRIASNRIQHQWHRAASRRTIKKKVPQRAVAIYLTTLSGRKL